MCCPLVFEFSVGIGGFVIGLAQISFFFSLDMGHMRISGTEPSYDCLLVLHLLTLFIRGREWKSSIQIGGWFYLGCSERSCIRDRSGLVMQSGDWSARRTVVGREERDLSVGSSGIQRRYSGC